jgi:hypothetical protein
MTKTLLHSRNSRNLLLGSTILAVVLAGCGQDGGSSSGASPTADRQDQGVKFAQCMRQHGIAMEDPKPEGGATLRIDKTNEAKMKAAQKACQKFSPMRQGDPQQQAADLERMTKLAQCLRRNGIPVKDPKPGKPFAIKSLKGSEAKTQAAMKTCQKEAGMDPPPGGAARGSVTNGEG